jgi:hypothetical protein
VPTNAARASGGDSTGCPIQYCGTDGQKAGNTRADDFITANPLKPTEPERDCSKDHIADWLQCRTSALDYMPSWYGQGVVVVVVLAGSVAVCNAAFEVCAALIARALQ